MRSRSSHVTPKRPCLPPPSPTNPESAPELVSGNPDFQVGLTQGGSRGPNPSTPTHSQKTCPSDPHAWCSFGRLDDSVALGMKLGEIGRYLFSQKICLRLRPKTPEHASIQPLRDVKMTDFRSPRCEMRAEEKLASRIGQKMRLLSNLVCHKVPGKAHPG